jgi:4a-hydroxytetrahydrobiopterin dehydratase
MSALSDDRIKQILADRLEGWSFESDKIHRQLKFKNFTEAVAFIVKVAFVAEEQKHHPELFNVYNNIKISLCTHDAGDKVTEKDIKLAEAIEEIYKQN